ncbi:Uncharacterised protein [Mycobacteroides abscessus subsp. abscessus]|nr:Uncharacterised protein [Mycobacteroides abscessus subsp. abscessus]
MVRPVMPAPITATSKVCVVSSGANGPRATKPERPSSQIEFTQQTYPVARSSNRGENISYPGRHFPVRATGGTGDRGFSG